MEIQDLVDIVSRSHGYPIVGVCADGGALCHDCMRDNLALISGAITDHAQPDWDVQAIDVHYEGNPIQCDNCYEGIESAYGPVEGE